MAHPKLLRACFGVMPWDGGDYNFVQQKSAEHINLRFELRRLNISKSTAKPKALRQLIYARFGTVEEFGAMKVAQTEIYSTDDDHDPQDTLAYVQAYMIENDWKFTSFVVWQDGAFQILRFGQ